MVRTRAPRHDENRDGAARDLAVEDLCIDILRMPGKTLALHFPHLASMAGRDGGKRLIVPHCCRPRDFQSLASALGVHVAPLDAFNDDRRIQDTCKSLDVARLRIPFGTSFKSNPAERIRSSIFRSSRLLKNAHFVFARTGGDWIRCGLSLEYGRCGEVWSLRSCQKFGYSQKIVGQDREGEDGPDLGQAANLDLSVNRRGVPMPIWTLSCCSTWQWRGHSSALIHT